jgi:hypothetical protein
MSLGSDPIVYIIAPGNEKPPPALHVFIYDGKFV